MTTPTPTPPDNDHSEPEFAALPVTATPTADAADVVVPEPEIGDRWGAFPTPERRTALDACLATWAAMPDHGELLSPFDTLGFRGLLNGADVYYLAARSLVGPEGDITYGVARLRNPFLPLPNLHLEQAQLSDAHLEHASLSGAHLERTHILGAYLADADLYFTYLADADLRQAQLERANLAGAHLERANLGAAHLADADLRQAQLEHANLAGAHLERANLGAARLEHASLGMAHLEGADLAEAWLEHAAVVGAQLERADLREARLERADLRQAHLEQADLRRAKLEGVDLRGAFLDVATVLADATVTDAEHGSVRVADVRWQGVNLAVVKEWPADMVLGDEQEAWKLARAPLPRTRTRGERREAVAKQRDEVREAFREAARANRQLAAAMREQGMNDEADHFAYRAQVMQRQLRRRQGHYLRALGSWLLDTTSGYGYRPLRSVVTYVLIILLFAGAYLLNAQFAAPHLRWDEALVLSVSSFHGRGFFTSGISLGDNLARLAAVEAIIGLLVEITFIATFTQRFFAK